MAKIQGKKRNILDEEVDLDLTGESFLDIPVIGEGANGEKAEEQAVAVTQAVSSQAEKVLTEANETSHKESKAEETTASNSITSNIPVLNTDTDINSGNENSTAANLEAALSDQKLKKRKEQISSIAVAEDPRSAKVHRMFTNLLTDVEDKPKSYVSAKVSDHMDMLVEEAIIKLRRKHNFKIDKRKFVEVGVAMLLRKLDLDEME